MSGAESLYELVDRLGDGDESVRGEVADRLAATPPHGCCTQRYTASIDSHTGQLRVTKNGFWD